MSSKKQKANIEIFDATGDVVYRTYVEDPSRGLQGAVLEGFAAPLAQMQGLNLSGAKLYWASLGDADLSFANFSGADLRGATLDGAICRQTNFRDANLGRDNLNGRTSLKSADLTGAILDGAILSDVVYDNVTKFPAGFDPRKHGLTHVDDLPANDPRRK